MHLTVWKKQCNMQDVDQISLMPVNTIYFKTILTLIRKPMYHFRVQALFAVSNCENTSSQVDVPGIHSKFSFFFFFCINTAGFSGKLLIWSHLVLVSSCIHTTKFQQLQICTTEVKCIWANKYMSMIFGICLKYTIWLDWILILLHIRINCPYDCAYAK